MSMAAIADIADLLAALGVMGTMLLLAREYAKGAAQSRLANWQVLVSALRDHKRRTDDPYVAKVVVRGREDFDALEAWEKLTFGGYMEEMIQGYDGLILHGGANVVRREDTYRAAIGAFRYHFGFAGTRRWWLESGLADRWPRHLVNAIEEAIATLPKAA